MVRDFAFGEAAAFFAFTADRVAARAASSVLGATAAAAAPGLLGATTAAPAPGVEAAGHAMIWTQETQLCTNRLFRTPGVFPRHQIIRVGTNARLFRGVEPPAGPRRRESLLGDAAVRRKCKRFALTSKRLHSEGAKCLSQSRITRGNTRAPPVGRNLSSYADAPL